MGGGGCGQEGGVGMGVGEARDPRLCALLSDWDDRQPALCPFLSDRLG